METTNAHRSRYNSLDYELKENEMILSTSSMVNDSTCTLPSMKSNCELLRNANSSEGISLFIINFSS